VSAQTVSVEVTGVTTVKYVFLRQTGVMVTDIVLMAAMNFQDAKVVSIYFFEHE